MFFASVGKLFPTPPSAEIARVLRVAANYRSARNGFSVLALQAV